MPERESAEADAPDERMYTSGPLEDEDGREYVIRQQNVGPGNELGGGEWPDPDTPARTPAPGAAEDDEGGVGLQDRASTRTEPTRAAASRSRRRPHPDPT